MSLPWFSKELETTYRRTTSFVASSLYFSFANQYLLGGVILILISSTNCSHGWRMDSTARTVLRDVTGDAWIRMPKQPLGTEISSTNCCHGWRMDSTAQPAPRAQISSTNCCHGWRMDSTARTAPRGSAIINELLSWVTHGFDSPNRP